MKQDEEMIRNLLAELRYVLETGDIRDSTRNSAVLRDEAAQRLGYDHYEAFSAWCDRGDPEA